MDKRNGGSEMEDQVGMLESVFGLSRRVCMR